MIISLSNFIVWFHSKVADGDNASMATTVYLTLRMNQTSLLRHMIHEETCGPSLTCKSTVAQRCFLLCVAKQKRSHTVICKHFCSNPACGCCLRMLTAHVGNYKIRRNLAKRSLLLHSYSSRLFFFVVKKKKKKIVSYCLLKCLWQQ